MAEERDKKGIQWNYETRREKYNESRRRAKAKVRTEIVSLTTSTSERLTIRFDQHRQCHAASVCC